MTEFLIDDFDKFLKTKKNNLVLNEIVKDRQNVMPEFLRQCGYSIKDESKNLTDEKISVHVLFDLLIHCLPYSLQDKMSKLNFGFADDMKSKYLTMKYALNET